MYRIRRSIPGTLPAGSSLGGWITQSGLYWALLATSLISSCAREEGTSTAVNAGKQSDIAIGRLDINRTSSPERNRVVSVREFLLAQIQELRQVIERRKKSEAILDDIVAAMEKRDLRLSLMSRDAFAGRLSEKDKIAYLQDLRELKNDIDTDIAPFVFKNWIFVPDKRYVTSNLEWKKLESRFGSPEELARSVIAKTVNGAFADSLRIRLYDVDELPWFDPNKLVHTIVNPGSGYAVPPLNYVGVAKTDRYVWMLCCLFHEAGHIHYYKNKQLLAEKDGGSRARNETAAYLFTMLCIENIEDCELRIAADGFVALMVRYSHVGWYFSFRKKDPSHVMGSIFADALISYTGGDALRAYELNVSANRLPKEVLDLVDGYPDLLTARDSLLDEYMRLPHGESMEQFFRSSKEIEKILEGRSE